MKNLEMESDKIALLIIVITISDISSYFYSSDLFMTKLFNSKILITPVFLSMRLGFGEINWKFIEWLCQ